VNKTRIKTLLKKRILILDGATGTELQKRGMPAGVCPEWWCTENPEVIQAVQREYGEAGADMVYTCTFGGNGPKLSEYGRDDVQEINRKLAVLSRQAVGPGVLVAGDIGPTGRFVEPFGDLLFEEAVMIFKEQVAGLVAGGVDLFVIETMMDIQEARAALLAVKETGDYFTMVTMTYEPEGRTLNGTDPVTALITLQSLGADAVGCNCSAGPEAMMEWIAAMKPYATVPLAAKPNAGIPRLVGITTTFDMDARAFGAFSKPFAAAGVNLLGGCCGTTPAYIGALKRELAATPPVLPRRKSLAALSSPRGHVILNREKPLFVIGERINPTGKKALQEELREGKTSLVRQMAREQEDQGADLLDVNVGVPGIDEPAAMKSLLRALAGTTDLPLVIDSPKVDTIAAALRLYPGRALLNSISGEREKMEQLLPLAARYGAMFILLPLLDGEIPETAAGRSKVIRDVYRAARRHDFTKEDIIVDGLVMTVAANPEAPAETLKTVSWCSRSFGCRTVLGVSNVSFGMPERKWLNATFLNMAQVAGLTVAIVNPANTELMAMKKAADVFLGKDREAAIYIESFREGEKTAKKPAGGVPLSPSAQVQQAILAGNRDDIVDLIAGLMKSDAGLPAARIVEELMIPAILKVGELYEQKTYFLPQLIASAEAMKKGLDHLEPLLSAAKSRGASKGVVILATVQGDIHDIGKNIVALMLRNYGYDVIDLGKDVATETVIEQMKKHKPAVVGLSALMTTTMTVMEKVMLLARQEGLATPFILGGAVVTQAYAASLGASYARDGVEAVRVIATLCAN
jgi:5-methyltetrahydrofolate--homocysteine methyltransferase